MILKVFSNLNEGSCVAQLEGTALDPAPGKIHIASFDDAGIP